LRVAQPGGVAYIGFIETRNPPGTPNPAKEPAMTHRTDTLIQRSTAVALAALVTVAVLLSIDGLARHDVVPQSLLAQQTQAQST
jgi:hypothetical protein